MIRWHGFPQCMCYMNIHEHPWTALGCRRVSNRVGVTTMKRLDQGHLHPKLEVPGLTCPGWKSNLGLQGRVGGEHSRKESFEQLVNSYSEHLHRALRQFHMVVSWIKFIIGFYVVFSGKTHTYYQVLIDGRDCPYIVSTGSLPKHKKLIYVNSFWFFNFQDASSTDRVGDVPGQSQREHQAASHIITVLRVWIRLSKLMQIRIQPFMFRRSKCADPYRKLRIRILAQKLSGSVPQRCLEFRSVSGLDKKRYIIVKSNSKLIHLRFFCSLQSLPEYFRANIYLHFFSFFSSFDATYHETNLKDLEILIYYGLTVIDCVLSLLTWCKGLTGCIQESVRHTRPRLRCSRGKILALQF